MGSDATQEPASQKSTIMASVNVVEPLGKEIFLDVTTGAISLTAVLGPDAEVKAHQGIELVPNMGKIHLCREQGGSGDRLSIFV